MDRLNATYSKNNCTLLVEYTSLHFGLLNASEH